jgi:signal peptidase II
MSLLKISRKHIPWIVILLVLLIDQTSKIIVKTQMTLGQNIPVLGNWFNIYFIENEGMAFGMQFSGEYGKLILSIFRIIAVIFIGWYIARLIQQKAHAGLIVSVSLIMAGAMGNIIDSAFYGMIFSESYFSQTAQFMPEGGGYASFLHGRVVDMLYFPIIRGDFPQWFPFWGGQEFIFFRPVFNVADSAITIGVFILLIFQKKFFDSVKKPELPKEEA